MDDVYGIVGTLLDGKYQVEAAVAEGGFGVVYRATHRSLQKPVALKLLKVPDDFRGDARAAFLASFADEARTTARLDHPAIVRVTDFGVSAVASGQRVPWMVLDWLDGQTLAARLDARRGRGGVTPAEALALLRPAFEALAWAHARGVVHRDLKPSNIMLVDEGAVPLRVLDFGIAKVLDGPAPERPSGETRSGTAGRAFSPGYAAPEQVGGTRTGPWTDVHALALVLTEMVTGKEAYPGTNSLEVSAAALNPRRPSPATFGVDVGPWEPILARAMAFKPADRHRDAGALLAELEAVVPAARAPRMQSIPGVSPQTLASGSTGDSAPRELSLGPGSTFGPYTIARVLGAGGMGTVYEATRSGLQKRVAVKVMHASAAQHAGGAERFIQEARAAVSVKHPHIVDVEDLGVIDGVPFMAMEFLEGEPLTGLLTREGPRTPEGALELMLPVLSAVAAVHEKGIVHRDLKPDNVYLWSPLAGQVHPKLLDFGIAKVRPDQRAGSVTATGMVLGTPHYLAPEQVSGSRHAVEASDQWALGVVFYQCLTGSLPFPGADVLSVLTQVLRDAPRPLRLLVPSLPAELEAVVMRALEKDPARRHASVRDFGRALLPFAAPATRDRWAREFGLTPSLQGSGSYASLHGSTTAAPDTFQRATKEIGVAAPKGSRRGVVLGAVAGVVLLAGGAIALAVAGASANAPAADQAATQASTTSAASASVRVELRGLPTGARVLIDGAPCEHPEATTLPRSSREVPVRVEAAGFQPTEFRIRPDRDQAVPVPAMVAITAPGAAPDAGAAPVEQGRALLAPDAIRRVVLRNIGQVNHCHEQGLAVNPNAAGRVLVRFEIGTSGRVTSSAVSETTYPIASVGECIADAVRRWRFPEPEGEGVVTVNYPFNLQAGSEGSAAAQGRAGRAGGRNHRGAAEPGTHDPWQAAPQQPQVTGAPGGTNGITY
ncbi:MAG: protein kinase [Polyangiales bacterium]